VKVLPGKENLGSVEFRDFVSESAGDCGGDVEFPNSFFESKKEF